MSVVPDDVITELVRRVEGLHAEVRLLRDDIEELLEGLGQEEELRDEVKVKLEKALKALKAGERGTPALEVARKLGLRW